MSKIKNYLVAAVCLLVLAGVLAFTRANTASEPAAPAFPRGVIVAWNAKSGAIPAGWVVCDGTNGTPDLRGRFLRGVATFADVGKMEGTEKHGHTVSGTTDNPRASNADAWGDTDLERSKVPQATGLDHTHRFSGTTTEDGSHIPPSYTVIYLMKK